MKTRVRLAKGKQSTRGEKGFEQRIREPWEARHGTS